MISHVSVGVKDIAKAGQFYDATLAPLGYDAPSRASVEQFHGAAIKAGGKDHGKPGLRKDYGENYYAAFAIDPEGYRLEAYCGR